MDRGTIVHLNLSPTQGHEQHGKRPCVVVSDSAVNTSLRYPLIAVVPVTSTSGLGALYPELAPGRGLTKTSYALVDQLRSVDKQRVERVFGRVAPDELAAIDQAIKLFLGL